MIRSHFLKKKGSWPGRRAALPSPIAGASRPKPRARSLAPGAAGLSSHAGLRAMPPCPHLTVGCAAPRAASSARKRQATPHGTCRRARRRPRSPPIAAGGRAIHSRTTERSGTRPNGGDRRAQNVRQIKCVDQLIIAGKGCRVATCQLSSNQSVAFEESSLPMSWNLGVYF